jgi:hypothetical protein
MNDAADDTSIICTLDTANIRRQVRFGPPAHDLGPFQKRIRIVLSGQRN